MNTLYKTLLGVALSLGVISTSNAQVSTYTFSQSSAAYTAITGGSVIATATGTTGAGTIDDVVYNLPTGTFPFTFMFNGIGYTGCNVSSNGFITFGTTAPGGTNYTPISGAALFAGSIAAWGGDVNTMFSVGASSVTGNIRVEVVGSFPNREVVIQYSNWRPSYSTSTTNAYALNYQIRLSEASNNIKIVYGTNGYVVGSTAITSTRQIGLRGATNADYNNRLNAAALSFTASTAGSANSSTQTFSTTGTTPGMPLDGLTYLWTAPAPPSCLVPTSFMTTNVTSNSASFTWAAGGTETAWDIFIGATPDATTAPTATTSVTSYTATSLTPNTTYSVYVRANCGGSNSAWTGLTFYTGYCVPAPTSVDNAGIINVDIANGAISNTSTAEPGNYANYSVQVANIFQGTTVPVAITYSTGYTYDTKIWIDFNDDLDFNDVGEEVYSGTSLATSPTTLAASMNIPLSAPMGTHRLRIGGVDVGPPTQCYSGSFGSFEDYSVNIQAAPACTAAPVAGTITGPTSVNIGTTNNYTISPVTGNIQWYTSSSLAGPWSAVSGATTTPANITATNTGTLYIGAIASTPGCPSDTVDAVLMVTVLFPGNDVCDAIPLSIGVNTTSYTVNGATTQTGEVVPPNTGFSTNTGWGNTNLSNSVWFTFVAPASGNVSIQSPDFDTQLAIWKAASCSDLLSSTTATLVAANDDDANYTTHAGVQFSSYVRAACLTPGATYFIQLDSYDTPALSGSSSRVLITDLGAFDASFTGLAANYCDVDANATLTPVTTGGLFTLNTSTTSITAFSPSTAGVGTHTITYSVYGCTSNSVTSVAVCSGIQTLASKTDGVSVYPNPTTGLFTVDVTNATASTKFEAYDALGKLVVKETLTNETNTINISKLKEGVYMYKIVNGSSVIKTGRIVKQ